MQSVQMAGRDWSVLGTKDDYMLAISSMAQSDGVSEVDRYIAMPAQAPGYKIGQIEINRLRREAELAFSSGKGKPYVDFAYGQFSVDYSARKITAYIYAMEGELIDEHSWNY
ncbi:MAG: DUF885 family protein [Rhodoferax sp.]